MNKIVNCKFQDGITSLSRHSFDLIFFDPPTEQSGEDWDKIISPEHLYGCFHFLKPNGVMVVWGTEKSNNRIKQEWHHWFRYNWYWLKTRRGSWLNSNFRPTTVIDELSVFCRNGFSGREETKMPFYREPRTNLLEYSSCRVVGKIHPHQKPLDLCKFIIETYTKVGDSVLDICFGSGSILQAAKILGRQYFGFESNPTFFCDAEHRLKTKNI